MNSLKFRTGSTFLNYFSSNLPWVVCWLGVLACNQKEAFPSFVLSSGSDPISNPTPRHHRGAIHQLEDAKTMETEKSSRWLIASRDARCLSRLLYKHRDHAGVMWVWGVLLCYWKTSPIPRIVTTRGPAHPARKQRLKEILIQYFVSKLTYMDPQYQVWVMNTK